MTKKIILPIFFVLTLITLVSAQVSPSQSVYIVQEGDNLYRIALRNKVSVTKLCQWNNMEPAESLIAGRELLISPPKNSPETAVARLAPAKTKKQQGKIHRVQSGETVPMIANTYGYTEEHFRLLNGLKRNEKVEPGRELKSCDCSCSENNEASLEASQTTVITKKTQVPKPSIKNQPDSDWQSLDSGWQIVSESTTTTKTSPNTETWTTVQQQNTPTKNTSPIPAQDKDTETDAKAIKDAPPSSFMNSEEMAMVDEINLVRTSPKIYIQYVEEYIKVLQENSDVEAIAAANELIEVLRTMPAARALATSECVFTAAKKHAIDQKPKGDIDHQGRDGSFAWDRVPRECPMMKDGGECLVGGGKTVRRSVMMLLVDSGIANRGHRTTILDPTWQFVGCYKIGTVGTMPNYWIQNFGK